MSIEQSECLVRFARCCADGWDQGWHERNGGNLSYRMTPTDVRACEGFFDAQGDWTDLGLSCPDLGGEHFVCTAAGAFLHNVARDLPGTVGIVQLDDTGAAWRAVWGFAGGARPTSELASHILCHDVCARRSGGAARVVYHAHPADVIAMSHLVAPEARAFTRALWRSMTECIMVFPQGVGAVPWTVPGSAELARATAQAMERFDAVVWACHGMIVSAAGFDEAFGLMHAVEKAAHIYLAARAASGGSCAFLDAVSDQDLRDICRALDLAPNEDFLD